MLMAGWVRRRRRRRRASAEGKDRITAYKLSHGFKLKVEAVSLPVPEPGAGGPHN